MELQPLELLHPGAGSEALAIIKDILFLPPLVMILRSVYRNFPRHLYPHFYIPNSLHFIIVTHTFSRSVTYVYCVIT